MQSNHSMITNQERLFRLMDDFSQYGGTTDGGMHRLTLSEEDRGARDCLIRWMHSEGLSISVDAIGNIFGLLNCAGPDAPVVMTGSHLDSQPHGGRLDGAYGVIAACEVLQAVRERIEREGIVPVCNIAVVDWTNEEGARFQPSLLGSSVYAGSMPLESALERQDGDGISVRNALSGIGYSGTDQFPFPRAYVELHVECGGVLEKNQKRFGAITRHWGAIKYRLAFIGKQSHTGPTPMADRRDALLAAARLIDSLHELAMASGTKLHTSVGRIEVSPNSPNVVPGEAVLFIELRSAEQDILEKAEQGMLASIKKISNCLHIPFEIRRVDRRPVGYFDPGLVALAEEEANRLGEVSQKLDTIAAHDAISMISVCPSVVLNVPSIGGICHHPDENTALEDLALGTEILAGVIWRLVTDGIPEGK